MATVPPNIFLFKVVILKTILPATDLNLCAVHHNHRREGKSGILKQSLLRTHHKLNASSTVTTEKSLLLSSGSCFMGWVLVGFGGILSVCFVCLGVFLGFLFGWFGLF